MACNKSVTKQKLIAMVERLIAAGMSEEKALKEVAFGYYVDSNKLKSIYKERDSDA